MQLMLCRFLTRTARPVVLGGVCVVAALMHFGANRADAGMPVSVQDGGSDSTKLVEDFLHYVLIAKPDLAEASGNALFDSGITDEQLANVISENDLDDKVERALRRGRNMEGVGPMVMQFERRLEDGRLNLSRNQDRITKSIEMLTGTMRAQMLGKRRLVEAGEYAVPQLLEVIKAGNNPELELACTSVLEEIKRFAVLPLCAAIGDLAPEIQVKICRILSAIGWPTAIPYLLDLSQTKTASKEVRDAASLAFRRLGGTSTDTSAAFAALARKFFDEEQSLVAYPSDPTNIVWSYESHSGLIGTSVPTEIYSQVMAMHAARMALDLEPSNRTALSLYVAADLRRENQLGSGQVDPFAADSRYSPQFFATASGVDIARSVLAMAIDKSDTALVRDAIEALGKTAGSGAMFTSGGRQPLLECLRYPDRRVQYDAALVLGSALPKRGFPGDGQVVQLLASAVRGGGSSYAVVIASSDENRNQIGGMLRENGFTVLNGGETFYEVEPEIVGSSGVDLIVVDTGAKDAGKVVGQIRTNEMTSATPVVVVADRANISAMNREFSSDNATGAWIAGTSSEAFKNATNNLIRRASGGLMTQADVMSYTRDALETLHTIAIEGNSIYKIRTAEAPLLEAMNSISGAMRMLVAKVVANVPTANCQRALIDAALAADGSDKTQLLDYAAMSAQKIGNQASQRQIDALGKLITDSAGSSGDPIVDAAGRLHGALNLSPDTAVKLITD
jgi:hypothetical protein